MRKSAAQQVADFWRERHPELAAAADDRRAAAVLDGLKFDFRSTYVSAFRERVTKSVAEQVGRAQLVAAAPILARWGSVQSLALMEPDGMTWLMFPPPVDPLEAKQLAGSREGQDRSIFRVRLTWQTDPPGYSIRSD